MSNLKEKLLELASDQSSDWKANARHRRENREWLKKSAAIAVQVLDVLKAQGLSQKDLAEKMSVSPAQVNKIVKGQENLTLETISILEWALGIKIIDENRLPKNLLSTEENLRPNFVLTKGKKEMKAAVMYGKGELPQYVDFPEPKAQSVNEILVKVKAVAIKHFDKGRAVGRHYSSDAPKEGGRIIGGDGICLLEDGTRVYGMGISGMLAEKATIDEGRIVKVPEGLDDVTAAALPNAIIGSAMGLRFKADVQRGDVVLVNGATGFTGRIAVQIAKHYGAKKVIVTGRNSQSLNDLSMLGADEAVSIVQDDEQFKARLKAVHEQTPIDVIIDYLWGHSAEMILACLKGDGSFTNKVRYVSVGSMTGDLIQLSAANLRSVNLQIAGSGLGAWTRQQVGQLFTEILPEMFQLAAKGQLKAETITVKLEDIAQLWDLNVPDGRRLVVTI